ncbi:MAG: NUDIX domain-containing protein [Nanoarchaeota archaeon]|nr:NUDIX domain-containing protein [Nanoarchaeota archaeon]
MIKERISAIILENKKVLLVTGYDEKFYWTPGGKLNSNESHEQTLKRELYEELLIEPISIKHYIDYTTINEISNEKQIVRCYIVSYKGNLIPQKEITKIFWFSKENFKNKNPKISEGIKKNLIPRLIKDKFL